LRYSPQQYSFLYSAFRIQQSLGPDHPFPKYRDKTGNINLSTMEEVILKATANQLSSMAREVKSL
jgi:hypothetical protein